MNTARLGRMESSTRVKEKLIHYNTTRYHIAAFHISSIDCSKVCIRATRTVHRCGSSFIPTSSFTIAPIQSFSTQSQYDDMSSSEQLPRHDSTMMYIDYCRMLAYVPEFLSIGRWVVELATVVIPTQFRFAPTQSTHKRTLLCHPLLFLSFWQIPSIYVSSKPARVLTPLSTHSYTRSCVLGYCSASWPCWLWRPSQLWI